MLNETVAVFPPSSRWQPNRQTVQVHGGTTYEVGSRVAAGGGYIPISKGLVDVIGEGAYVQVLDCVQETHAKEVSLFAPEGG
jgi:hypothetical protein